MVRFSRVAGGALLFAAAQAHYSTHIEDDCPPETESASIGSSTSVATSSTISGYPVMTPPGSSTSKTAAVPSSTHSSTTSEDECEEETTSGTAPATKPTYPATSSGASTSKTDAVPSETKPGYPVVTPSTSQTGAVPSSTHPSTTEDECEEETTSASVPATHPGYPVVTPSTGASTSKTEAVPSSSAPGGSSYPGQPPASETKPGYPVVTPTYSTGVPPVTTVVPVPSQPGAPVSYSISTIYSTKTHTITSCAPEVTNCPNGPGIHTTTEVVEVGTTLCPVTETKPIPGVPVTVVTPGAPIPSDYPNQPPTTQPGGGNPPASSAVSITYPAGGNPPASSAVSTTYPAGGNPPASSAVPSYPAGGNPPVSSAVPSYPAGGNPSSSYPVVPPTLITSTKVYPTTSAPGNGTVVPPTTTGVPPPATSVPVVTAGASRVVGASLAAGLVAVFATLFL